jgi:tetraprenyl-beta-curcumene synthase
MVARGTASREAIDVPHTSINRHQAIAFTLAARRYWMGVFPTVRYEIRHLRQCADHIPSTELRTLALRNLGAEGKNLEGAAAFSAFLPRAHRASVVRAQVAFQAAYDYVDSLAEQTHAFSRANAQQLHHALIVAVSPGTPHAAYYQHHTSCSDGGYLAALVDSCRRAISRLPSYPIVADAIGRNTQRIIGYQTRTNLTSACGLRTLSRWACLETPLGADLRWWETAAACGSSMAVLALLAAAADPLLTRSAAETVEAVYWPWAGALHSLLDSLIDYAEDATAGRHNLTVHYASSQEMANRMHLITTEAARRASAIGVEHSLILTGMASLYLSDSQAARPEARQTAIDILAALGGLASPAMLMLRTRRLARRPQIRTMATSGPALSDFGYPQRD